MSKATAAQFQKIIVMALLDPEFYKALRENPAATIKNAGVEFDPQDHAGLALIFGDLDRFAKFGQISETDAKSWAIGICQVKTVSSSPIT